MIVVLNPNSSPAVSAAIERACSAAPMPPGSWRVDQLDAAPAAIESDEDVAAAGRLVAQYAAAHRPETLVVACHSDPGLDDAREVLGPGAALGIGETSMLVAAARAARFGVVSLTDGAVERKWAMLARLRVSERCAAVVATGTRVLDGVDDGHDEAPYVRAAEQARAAGAGAVVLGCAGMADVARSVQRAVGVPVVEPVAATLMVAGIGRGEAAL